METRARRAGKLTLRMRLCAERAFIGCALPMTAEVAEALRPFLHLPRRNLHRNWPYMDRVVVWLVPSLGCKVEVFHAGHGSALVEIVRPATLSRLDRILAWKLGQHAEKETPGILDVLATIMRE